MDHLQFVGLDILSEVDILLCMSRFKLPDNYKVEYYHTAHGCGEYISRERDGYFNGVIRRITTADIIDGDWVVAQGIAICNEEVDNFSRKIGRQIALGRALKALEIKHNTTYGTYYD